MELIAGLLGGVGIFLLGMILLTEGLKSAAGDALRSVLARYAGGPGTALLSGAGVTALVQSSSATTLTTIGFVSAGLLTFPQAVGVIFGANLGTTSTGWLASVVGFKVSLSAVAFPLVGVGALVRLLSTGRRAHAGMALAGFGLIFVGIDVLQGAMAGLAERVDPGSFPGATLGGRMGLVLLGVVMTVVMQSSSAAIATTLAAVHSGTLGLEQAALLVVGQNLGTTVKALLASIGGSVPVKRTVLAHILFNLITAALALTFLPLFLLGAVGIAGEGDPAVAIALFHTSFNLAGVLVLFPFLGAFARMVERMVPETTSPLTRHLDSAVAALPAVAVEVARRSALQVALLLFHRCSQSLRGEGRRPAADTEHALAPAAEAIGTIRRFLAKVRTSPGDEAEHDRHLSLLHAVDHLDGFLGALREYEAHPPGIGDDGPARAKALLGSILAVRGGEGEEGLYEASRLEEEGLPDASALEEVSMALASLRKEVRADILSATALGELDPGRAWDEIEVIKILDRLGYHAWRTVHHLVLAGPEARWDSPGRDSSGPTEGDGGEPPGGGRRPRSEESRFSSVFEDREDGTSG
jgi:phosphate:Na+ symporter